MSINALSLETQAGRLGKADELLEDAEFRALQPFLSAEEQEQIANGYLRGDPCEPLIVWPYHGRRILLTGYHLLPLLRRYGRPFREIEETFPDREAARRFLTRYLLARPYLPPLAMSYVRGVHYNQEKQARPGRPRKSAQRPGPYRGRKTAEALAENFGVTPKTIRADGIFATAVDRIAAICGLEIKRLLLSRNARLTRRRILAVARLKPGPLRRRMTDLRTTGKWLRSWSLGGKPAKITVPAEPRPLAQVLLRRWGREKTMAFDQILHEILAAGPWREASSPDQEEE
jgi:hypothetical protein